MFNTDIVLAGDAGSSTTYSLTSISGGNSDRFDATAAADAPKGLFIKHEKVKRNGLSSTRHLIRLERTSPQATTLLPVTGSVHLVVEEPGDTITSAQLKDMITQLRNFLTASGYVDKLFNDEP